MVEFELKKGEKLIEEIKPVYKKAILSYTIGKFFRVYAYVLLGWTIVSLQLFDLLFNLSESRGYPYFSPFGTLLLFLILLILIKAVLSALTIKNLNYWITNKRIIIKKGLFSPYFVSIYYDRIVSIEAYDSYYGSGLLIKQAANPFIYPVKFFMKGKGIEAGGTVDLIGLSNPEETKNKILRFVKFRT